MRRNLHQKLECFLYMNKRMKFVKHAISVCGLNRYQRSCMRNLIKPLIALSQNNVIIVYAINDDNYNYCMLILGMTCITFLWMTLKCAIHLSLLELSCDSNSCEVSNWKYWMRSIWSW